MQILIHTFQQEMKSNECKQKFTISMTVTACLGLLLLEKTLDLAYKLVEALLIQLGGLSCNVTQYLLCTCQATVQWLCIFLGSKGSIVLKRLLIAAAPSREYC